MCRLPCLSLIQCVLAAGEDGGAEMDDADLVKTRKVGENVRLARPASI